MLGLRKSSEIEEQKLLSNDWKLPETCANDLRSGQKLVEMVQSTFYVFTGAFPRGHQGTGTWKLFRNLKKNVVSNDWKLPETCANGLRSCQKLVKNGAIDVLGVHRGLPQGAPGCWDLEKFQKSEEKKWSYFALDH